MLRGQIDMSRKPSLQSIITKVFKRMIAAGAKPGRVEFRPADGSFTVFSDNGGLTESSSPKIEEPSLSVRFDHRWGGRNGQ
jgi:hypothetical protein